MPVLRGAEELHMGTCIAPSAMPLMSLCVCVVALWQAGGVLARWQYRVSRSRVCWRVLSVCWTGARRPQPVLGASGSEEGLVAIRVSNSSDPPLNLSSLHQWHCRPPITLPGIVRDACSPHWARTVWLRLNRSDITSFLRLLVCLGFWRRESRRWALYVIVRVWGEMFYPAVCLCVSTMKTLNASVFASIRMFSGHSAAFPVVMDVGPNAICFISWQIPFYFFPKFNFFHFFWI